MLISVGSDLQRYCKSADPRKFLYFSYSTMGRYCVNEAVPESNLTLSVMWSQYDPEVPE
jgi:hypothetical protein